MMLAGELADSKSGVHSGIAMHRSARSCLGHVCAHLLPRALHRTAIIAAQHILPSTLSLVEEMMNAGLEPHNLFMLGKCYSTDDLVMGQLLELGVDVSATSMSFDPRLPYDTQYQLHVGAFLSRSLDSLELEAVDRIIILDDGGYLLAEAAHHCTRLPVDLVGVEQTSSGYAKLQHLGLSFPVVNIARCRAKLDIEAKWIAEQAVYFLTRNLDILETPRQQALILGGGAIGRAVLEQVRQLMPVAVVDPRSDLPDVRKTICPRQLADCDLVIGCTGQISLPERLHTSLTEGTALVSLSSSDREFDAVHLRNQSTGDIRLSENVNCAGVHLINCGFPISFQGPVDLVDPPHAYFTRALLYAGVVLANQLAPSNACYIEPSLDLQNELRKCFDDVFAVSYSCYAHQVDIYRKSANFEQTTCR